MGALLLRILATNGEEYTLIIGPGGLGGASPAPTRDADGAS
jgi:hypothetical protein